ncbi:hypothetical protein [Alicyclobacillus acidiphilus]|uniref:hypothetical protein n=1 Tax=Alicyclobacillus acidiphilus TaxID=182455 RepID=UPI0012ECF3D2|nr:hypothetical protein [Alicyclobacillus acidiphilus]
MDKSRYDTTDKVKDRKRRSPAKVAVIAVIALAVLFVLLEWQEFVHLSSNWFYGGR